MKIQFKIEDIRITSDNAPKIETSGSAGIDLRACTWGESVTIAPGRNTVIPCGVSVAIPTKHVGLLMVRSSVGIKRGLMLANGAGVIDSDYRGELLVALHNTTKKPVIVRELERIAQLVIVPHVNYNGIEVVEELPVTARGTKGVGSTGTK